MFKFALIAAVFGLSVMTMASPASAVSATDTVTISLNSTQSPLKIATDYPYGVVVDARDSVADESLTLTATGVPPGMTFASTCLDADRLCEGTVSGTPDQVGSYTLEVTATDATGATSTLDVPVVVNDAITLAATVAQPDYPTIGVPLSVPVTATSAAGATLNITATGLPPGLSLITTGTNTAEITGTPTTAGFYEPTVVASNPAGGNDTISLAWFVHGTITIKDPGNLTSTAGYSGALDMSVADSVNGADLGYYATGLPPGIAQESEGNASAQFAGWLTKAGTYHVTLHAYDNYQANDSVSFTWTVRSAAASGPTGAIHLAYRGSCVAGSGARVEIWNCNGGSAQQWMLAQDWTVRVHGGCLAEIGTSNGSRVAVAPCNGSTAQQWEMQAGPQSEPELTNLASGRCLNDPGYSTREGTQLNVSNCDAADGQYWVLPAEQIESQIPGMCLADPANKSANGTRIVFWQCNGWHEEAFTFEPDGAVQINGKCLTDYRGSSANGTPLVLEPCVYQERAEMWENYPYTPVSAGGALQNGGNGDVVGIDSNTAVNGTPVGLYTSGVYFGYTVRVR